MIEAAAQGSESDREHFAEIYLPIVQSYLRHRWKSSPLINSVDDASQDVFLECFKASGPLSKAERDRAGGFRAFLFGIARNVARRFETRKLPDTANSSVTGRMETISCGAPSASIQFDRVWAKAMMARAAETQKARAEEMGSAAVRRVELLRLRFQENMPIRKIAKLWEVEAAWLHHEFAKARKEFHAALLVVVQEHGTGSAADARQECRILLEILR